MRSYGLFMSLLVSVMITTAVSEDEYHPDFKFRSALRTMPDRFQFESNKQYWYKEARKSFARRLHYVKSKGSARNVIIFLGDGMSTATLTAARILHGQRRSELGEEAQLSFESFPALGLAKTYCVDAQIPDSACTATAYLCGAKNNFGVLGLTAAVPRHDCVASLDPSTHLDSIATWALESGRDAGIVTTTRVTHASPAGTYAHVSDRNWESDTNILDDDENPRLCDDIAKQLVTRAPGNRFKVILGGGRREFIPTTAVDEDGAAGRRKDDRNLIKEWCAEKTGLNLNYKYIWNRDQLLAANASLPNYLLGLFSTSHMPFHRDRNPKTSPTLAELTEVAIRMLSRNKKGFFLFVESGRIDHAHHVNNVELALDETLALNEAVARATEMLSEDDSLIVVTADHGHGMTFNGYSSRGRDILGPADIQDNDNVTYMTLSYTNGPGQRTQVDGKRADITIESNYRKSTWRSHAEIPLDSETHSADEVAVFARGPHSGLLTGMYEQSQLPHALAYAACMGPGPHACNLQSQYYSLAATGCTSCVYLLVLLQYTLLLYFDYGAYIS